MSAFLITGFPCGSRRRPNTAPSHGKTSVRCIRNYGQKYGQPDKRRARRYLVASDHDATKLRTSAKDVLNKSAELIRTATATHPRSISSARADTNHETAGFNQDTKAIVQELRKVQTAAAEEAIRLQNTLRDLEVDMETPLRTLWLYDQAVRKRRERPHCKKDAVMQALSDERDNARRSKTAMDRLSMRLQRHILETKRARDALAKSVKKRTSALQLNPESFSRIVRQRGVRGAREEEGGELARVRRCMEMSVAMRESVVSKLDALFKTWNVHWNAVNQALVTEVRHGKAAESNLTLQRAQTRMACDKARHRASKTHARLKTNIGPECSRYMTVAERMDRPTVKVSRLPVTAPERRLKQDAAGKHMKLRDILAILRAGGDPEAWEARDPNVGNLARNEKLLAHARHDKRLTWQADQEVLRLRRRYHPRERA